MMLQWGDRTWHIDREKSEFCFWQKHCLTSCRTVGIMHEDAAASIADDNVRS